MFKGGLAMPSHKDPESKKKTWYCKFNYRDWKGEIHQKKKRGFKSKHDADQWERDFLNSQKRNCDIKCKNLVENYMKDMAVRLKPTTMETKESLISTKLLPTFGEMPVCDIDELAVRNWQNELLKYRDEKTGEPYKETYLRTINNQLSAVMNYACTFYRLDKNPCQKVGSIGKSEADAMQIWTLGEYENFIQCEMKQAGRLAFDIFYWSGIREGELLALSITDFQVGGPGEYWLNVDKNYEVVKGVEYILTPKTPNSIRRISIPEFLYYEALSYYNALYEPDSTDRLFYFRKHFLLKEIKRVAKLAGMEPIRVHDLRHSHASLLIEMGFNILMVSQRLGHEKVETTWNTYAHLYPNKEKMLATQLNTVKIQGLSDNVSVEAQLLNLLNQFQKQIVDSGQPAIIDISNETIIRWDPAEKQKEIVTREEFENAAELEEDIEAALADTEIFQTGYLELCGMVYCLASRGLPFKYL